MIDLAVLGQDPGFRGGVTAQITPFLDGAARHGYAPTLLYLAYGALDSSRDGVSAPTVPVGQAIPGLDAVNQFASAHRLAPLVREARSVWVNATHASHGYAALLARRPYGAWIGTTLESEWRGRRHGLDPSRRAALRLSGPVLRRLERATLRGAAALYATTPSSARAVAAAAGARLEDVGILPIPVSAELFAPLADEEWRAGLDRPTIVFVGRAADPRKNVSLLFQAFTRVRRVVPNARLRLVGAPPSVSLPDGAEATGVVNDVGAHLRDAAVLVVASLQEGFGVVVAEALACGVPVVVTPCGGPEDLVRSSGGGIVLDDFGPEEMAKALEALLADPDRLTAMRLAGGAHVRREHAPERFLSLLGEAFTRVENAT